MNEIIQAYLFGIGIGVAFGIVIGRIRSDMRVAKLNAEFLREIREQLK